MAKEEAEDENLKEFPINFLGGFLGSSNSQDPFEMVNKNNGKVFSAGCLVGIHEPTFMSYDIGERILLGVEGGLEVVAYYAGFNESSVKFGEIRVPRHILSDSYPRDSVLYTKVLERLENFKCTSPKQVANLINFLSANPRPIVEIAFGDKRKIIGYLGKQDDGILDLAHSLSLKGGYDSWYKPAHWPQCSWANPEKKLSLDGVSSIALFGKLEK